MGFIEFKKITKEYKMGNESIWAAKEVDFEIEKGEFVVILGPSGAGKSTILNLLGGMDQASSGELFVDGRDITTLNDKELTKYRGTDVGFVFQFYNLIPALTVYENVALIKETSKASLNVDEVIEEVGLSNRKDLFPTQLSGGEQERVSVARAVCKNPKLLLCDEPTGALDSQTGVNILGLLLKMSKENGHTVIIVTHNSNYAQIADKVIYLKNGKVTDIVKNNQPLLLSEVNW